MKNLLAIVVGLVLAGVGVWRITEGQVAGGTLVIVAGAFLLFRGLTGTVRPGL